MKDLENNNKTILSHCNKCDKVYIPDSITLPDMICLSCIKDIDPTDINPLTRKDYE